MSNNFDAANPYFEQAGKERSFNGNEKLKRKMRERFCDDDNEARLQTTLGQMGFEGTRTRLSSGFLDDAEKTRMPIIDEPDQQEKQDLGY